MVVVVVERERRVRPHTKMRSSENSRWPPGLMHLLCHHHHHGTSMPVLMMTRMRMWMLTLAFLSQWMPWWTTWMVCR